MTYAGAFQYLYEKDPTDWSDKEFTLIKVTRGGHDQTTGERTASVRATSTIKGSLDPVTEEDLNLYGISQLIDGDQKFFTEQSYDVEVGDIIKAPDGRKFRVHERLALPRIVTQRMGNDADMVGYHVYLTTGGEP